MPKQKQENSLSFKVSNSMIGKIEQEQVLENRSQSDMAKILIAEALCIREAKRNINKIL
jgi:hypothetical protein